MTPNPCRGASVSVIQVITFCFKHAARPVRFCDCGAVTGDNDVIGREQWRGRGVVEGGGGEGGHSQWLLIPPVYQRAWPQPASLPGATRWITPSSHPLPITPPHRSDLTARTAWRVQVSRLPESDASRPEREGRRPYYLCHLHVCDFNDRRCLHSPTRRGSRLMGGPLIHLVCAVHMHTHASAHGINIA